MSPIVRRWLALLTVISLTLLGCATMNMLLGRDNPPTSFGTASPTPTTFEGTTPLETASATEATTSTDHISAEVRAKMEEIQDQVITLRGLGPNKPVDRELLSSQQLRQRVIDDFLEEYTPEQAQDDVRVLAMLGLLSPDFDLHGFYIDLYSEQVAGYYDSEAEEMVVVQGIGFNGVERLTYAHEYVHALQDQNFDMEEGLMMTDEACEEDSERCAAVQALVEGDASLLEEQWLRTYASDEDINDIFEFYDTFSSPVYDTAPPALQEDFIFPYTYGRQFVQGLYREGGWAAVDQAFQNPPASTEQILHPELYPHDQPVWLEVPDLLESLGTGWRELDQDVLGEWFTTLTLRVYLSEEEAAEAAAGWAGDYYLAFRNDEGIEEVWVLLSQWDTVRDAHQFTAAFKDYGDERYGERAESSTTLARWEGPDQAVLIEISGDQTLWIAAPDAAILERLRESIPFPADPR